MIKTTFNPKELTINFDDTEQDNLYEIDMEEINTNPEELLDYIFQIAGKNWCTPEVLKDFINCIENACQKMYGINAQGVYCHHKNPPKISKHRRIQSWIYKIINEVKMIILSKEISCLKNKNWTWRYIIQECEDIMPIKESIKFEMCPIYEDFCIENKEIEKLFSQHDGIVKDLNKAISEFYDCLLKSNPFQEKLTEIYHLWYKEQQPYENYYKRMIENRVNFIEELPINHSDKEFWNKFKDELKQYTFSEIETKIFDIGNNLLEFDIILSKILKDLRTKLCVKYDIPAAPVTFTHYPQH